MPRFGTKRELALYRSLFLTIVMTLVMSLGALSCLIFLAVRIVSHGHPTLPLEMRLKIGQVVFSTTSVVMLGALGAAAWRIGKRVAAYVRALDGERIAKELQLASDIQMSAMPQTFPPYPEVKEFDIYAMMKPAREVGGDFYDFYFSRIRRLVFLVADVSGKGVPAALFMMRAKSLLKGFVQTGIPLAEAVKRTNEGLCEGNDASVFVTAWIGELDLETGAVTYVNAGHNRPILRKAGGEGTDYVRDVPCLFLGAMPGVKYVAHRLRLAPGDSLYLYTDGVTEQVNARMELFGEDRLLYAVKNTPLRQLPLLERVVRAVSRHRGNAEQSDDCTQLEIVWRGIPRRTVHDYPPTKEGLAQAAADLEQALEGVAFGPKMELLTAADEVFMNIVSHSGATSWSLAVERASHPEEVRLVFTDDGTPFDPLKVQAPDTSIAVEERSAGGLGIFIVKKTMSPVAYAYHDGHNVLTLGKSLEAGHQDKGAPETTAEKIPLGARMIRTKG